MRFTISRPATDEDWQKIKRGVRATIEAKDAEIARLKMRVQQLRAIIDDAAEAGWM